MFASTCVVLFFHFLLLPALLRLLTLLVVLAFSASYSSPHHHHSQYDMLKLLLLSLTLPLAAQGPGRGDRHQPLRAPASRATHGTARQGWDASRAEKGKLRAIIQVCHK